MKFISKVANYGFGAVFLFGIICASIKIYSVCSNRTSLAFLAVAFLISFALLICYGLKKSEIYFKRNDELCHKMLVLLPAILLLFQMVFVICFDFIPKNDLSYICNAAENYVKYGIESLYNGLPERHQHYFEVYPNNHMLFWVIAGLYKISYSLFGEISNLLPTLINVLALDIAYIFMLKTAIMIYELSKAVVCGICGLMFTPIVTYSTFFYTDSLAMPFVSVAIYVYFRCRREEKLSCQMTLTAVCGIVIAIGYKIKGSLIILLIAILIDIIIRKGGIKVAVAKIGTIFGSFCVVVVLLNILLTNTLKISKEEKNMYEFPRIHWVMMSADGYGGYNTEDFYYTKSFEGYENKISADVDRLCEKLEKQGVIGFTVHTLKKIGYTWSNGTYMVPYYNENSKFLNSIPFVAITTVLHFSLLFKILQGFYEKRKDKNDVLSESFVLKICLIGLFGFLLIWETRCRYLVSFFALFALI